MHPRTGRFIVHRRRAGRQRLTPVEKVVYVPPKLFLRTGQPIQLDSQLGGVNRPVLHSGSS
jgi:hypothetical protein